MKTDIDASVWVGFKIGVGIWLAMAAMTALGWVLFIGTFAGLVTMATGG